ncbi:protein kinase domain-containing protein [Nonomuraea sp. CA-143628]|uniref:serine/threonine protein kinase n=1 Tax=Nonomuraea sp. CA-143628 TaxID=3239997 RepID=UPI003D8A86DA
MPNAEPLRPGDPEVIAAYRIVGRLGEGGQGIVYLGQAPDGRPVAVKVLRQSVGGDDRFAKEIAAARRVEPFCIAQVLDASMGGRPYIVSEYVEGPSLQQAGRHSGGDLQRLAVSTATALTAIHQAGIVHRDFKPANVLLGRDGPRVVDFGLARVADSAVTVTSSVVGTPAYMAPEQLAGAYVGPAADVFAWASVMVYAATGTPPFGEDSLPAVINRILSQEPFLGDLPEPLRSVVYTCLAKDPAARPQMQDVLLRLLGGANSAGNQHMPPAAQHAPSGPGYAPPGPGHTPPGPGYASLGPGHVPPGLGHAPAGGGQRPTRQRPTHLRRRFPLVAGVSGAVAVCLAAGVIVWKGPLNGGQALSALAANSSEPSPSATPTKHKKTAAPKKTQTSPITPKPTHSRSTPKPTHPLSTPEPSQERTPVRSTPKNTPKNTPRPTSTPTNKPTSTATKKPTTTRPSPTATKKTKTASFSLAYVRVAGSSKINDEGITCYRGSLGFGIGIDSSEMGAPFSYQWIVDGQVIESGSRRIPSYGRSDYFGSKKQITPELGTKHTVVFRLTSPTQRTKSTSWTMC